MSPADHVTSLEALFGVLETSGDKDGRVYELAKVFIAVQFVASFLFKFFIIFF